MVYSHFIYTIVTIAQIHHVIIFELSNMPQQSKYSDSQFEAIMHDIIIALEKNKANRDLSLMVLGNVVTSIFHQQVPENQRQQMAEQFTQVLLKSINGK
jgi:uncharacterized protein YejL (UPF0352 family)